VRTSSLFNSSDVGHEKFWNRNTLRHCRIIFESVSKLVPFFALAICTFPYLFPFLRDNGLDHSWITGINQCSALRMVHGKEIVFTYGPLGFVDCPVDIANNVAVAIFFRLLIYCIFLFAIVWTAHHIRTPWSASFQIVVILVLTALGNRFFYSVQIQLLIAVLGFLVTSHLKQSVLWASPAAALAGLALLVKFNIGIACVASLGSWVSIMLAFRRTKETFLRVGIVACVFLLSLVGLFLQFGGPPAALIDYIRFSFVIARGYSSQMSVEYFDHSLGLALCIVQVAILSCVIIWGTRSNRRYLTFILLVLPSLFVLFKGGFVRYDRFHADDFFIATPVIASFLLLLAREPRQRILLTAMLLPILMISIAWYLSIGNTFSNPIKNGWMRIEAVSNWSVIRESIAKQDAEFLKRQKLPTNILIKIGNQAVDAYPWEISIPVANDLNWKPRFVFQSYIAYTPELDRANAAHYSRSQESPSFVLYSHQAIDNQHPFTTDPLTWLELFRWYDIEEDCAGSAPVFNCENQFEDMFLLRRRQSARVGQPQFLGEKVIHLGERFDLPSSSKNLILLQARFKLRAVGAMRDYFFKNYAPEMMVEYQNGIRKTYRLVWRNAASGFLVSDLPLDISQVRSLWKGGVGSPVKAITFFGIKRDFEPTVSISWHKLPYLNP